MAKKVKLAGRVSMKDVEVANFLTWLLEEIKAELEDLCNSNVRLIKIKYEAERLLKKYDIVR